MGARATIVAVVAALVGAGQSACKQSSAFQCGSNEQCGTGGTCEPDGYCSFPDDTCPSGRRYGELAGGGLAGECVAGMATTGTDDGLTGVEADTSAAACADATDGSAACSPLPPEGWLGPVLAIQAIGSQEPQDCPPPVPMELALLHGDLDAPPASCACACDDGGGCGDAGATYVTSYDDCLNGGGVELPLPDGCVSLPGLGFPGGAVRIDAVGAAPACMAQTPVVTVNPPQWGHALRLCTAFNPTDCIDGICVPDLDNDVDSARCVFREGDHPCPLEHYVEPRGPLFASFDDTRACDPCECELGIGGTGAACALLLYENSDCSGVPSAASPLDGAQGCIPIDDGAQGAEGALMLTSDCAASDGVAVGEATPTAPMTVCCAP